MATQSRRRVEYADLTWFHSLAPGETEIWLLGGLSSLPIATFGLQISGQVSPDRASALWAQLKESCEALLGEFRNLPDDGVYLPKPATSLEQEEAFRFEHRRVTYSLHPLPSGGSCVLMGGWEFPSLPNADFALVLRPETTLPQARALVVALTRGCPTMFVQLSRDPPDDFPHYAAELDPDRFDPDERSLFAR